MSRAHSLICVALIAFQCHAMPTLNSDLQGAATPAVAESNAVVTEAEGAKDQVIPANIVLTPNPGPSDPSILLFPFVTVDPEEKEELVNAVVNQKGEETQALDANKIENLLSPDCFWAPVAVLPKGIEGGVLAPIEPPFILPVIQNEETNKAVKDYQQQYNKHLAAMKASKTVASLD